ncbi:hypothetical protein BJY04DRAFT_226175 [Aspergillus karnatakaensis]|uniref:uncharacterized protein n=1 Tax=Aspergillus karnatakaensis TaxID=1810916 RepID=UPI003CCE0339
MPPDNASSSALPAGRTGHACVQCRHRKQKCGGFTYDIKCRPCTTRKVKCSFQEEIKDLRYNPYLLRLRPPSQPIHADDDLSNSPPRPGSTPFDAEVVQSPSPNLLSNGQDAASVEQGLPGEIDTLKARIADLESRLVDPVGEHRDYIQTPQGHAASTFVNQFEPEPTHDTAPSLTLRSLGSSAKPTSRSLPSPQSSINTDGPLKALNSIQTDDPAELESHDPIARSVLTEGEAHVLFRLYFEHCHPNAPFLDVSIDNDVDQVRIRSGILFTAILCVGARFWSASSKAPCWLHPRYTELVRLLDAEVMRVTLRPSHNDQKLETIQALMLCAHWMPFDPATGPERFRSRFSEGGAWQCLGLAIRWATSLALERSCHTSFLRPEMATRDDVRRYRTMLYLVESDHYLALSARRPSYLDPKPLHDVLKNYLQCRYVQNTDIRLASLFRVAYGAHFTGCRPTTVESVEAFDKDVELIERQFLLNSDSSSTDGFSQHFPFTSLRWYRLSYACAFLDATDPAQRDGKALAWAIEWASQILYHLSLPLSSDPTNPIPDAPLKPNPSVVKIMSFAIDHYFVVIAYAAFFLINSWVCSLMDLNVRPYTRDHPHPSLETEDPSSSFLYRLVDVAARTLEAASPSEGHLARRYAPLLRGMTNLILSSATQAQTQTQTQTQSQPQAHGLGLAGTGPLDPQITNANANTNILPADQLQSHHLGEDLWEMWQQAGLEPMIWSNLLDDL